MSTSVPPPQRLKINKHAVIYPVVALVSMGIGGAAVGNSGSTDSAQPLALASAPTVTSTATVNSTVTATSPPQVTTVTKRAAAKVNIVTRTKTKTVTTAPQAADGGGSVYYDTCADARAAGDTPLYRGDPGYDSHLDRDRDGVACE